MADEQRTQWLRGVTDLVILAELGEGRSYGYELVERLTGAGFHELSEATVYGTLRRLESQGLLSSELAASVRGPARRYYRVTAAGHRTCRELVAEWGGFTRTVDRIVHRSDARRQRGAS